MIQSEFSLALQTRPRKERKENADKRRQQLLDATLRSIAANGLAKTTLATVANEAGLSQGVAVFYFKTKTGLLASALREHYTRYQENWKKLVGKVGSDPLAQLIALIEADFSSNICNPETMSIWFAFWGEQSFTPQYAEVSAEFDIPRGETIEEICAGLLPNADKEEVTKVADWIETMTEGYWQRLHVYPASTSRQDSKRNTLEMIAKIMPQHATRVLAYLKP